MEEINNYDHFDPEKYIHDYYVQDGTASYNEFCLTKLNSLFQSGLLKGRSMLELGTGPVPIASMFAADHYDEIYLSDYGKPNLEFLNAWMNGEKTKSLRPVFAAVADKIGNGKNPEDVENSLRKKIESVMFCDLRKANTIEPRVMTFDFAAAMYCVDEIVANIQQLEEILVKCKNLLNPNGLFLYFGDDSTFYEVNGERWQTNQQKIGAEEKVKAFEEAGYNVVEWTTNTCEVQPELYQMYDGTTDHVILARKNKNPEDVENSLRKKIESVMFCDLRKANTIEPRVMTFDFAAAMYCVDEIVANIQQLEEILVKCKNLLNPNGLFLYFGDDSTFYEVNGERWQTNQQKIGAEEKVKAFEEAGYNVVEWTTNTCEVQPELYQMYDGTTDHVILARKK